MTVQIVNDRDVLIRSAVRDADPRANKYMKLSSNSLYFHMDKDGAPSMTSITFTATPVNISGGTVAFSVSAGTLTNISGNTCTLEFANMPVGTVAVTAAITDQGQTFTDTMTISKLQDGVIGNDGAPGPQYATAYLYKWSSANPGLPNGTSTLSWNVGANTSYVGTDGWYITPPANPGGSLVSLWVASVAISAPGDTPTSTVSYTSAALYTISKNGAPGARYQIVRAYQWSTGATPTAAGTATFTWATGDYNNVPTGWTKTKPATPVLGATLFEASVAVMDTNGSVTTTNFDWGTASISSIGYAGANGTSSTIAYVLVDGSSLNTTPASVTTSGTAFPTTGTWGETRAWSTSVPIPAAGQSVFQTNGTYNPSAAGGAGQTTWSVPYMSNFRVGSLSALVVNTGNLTISGVVSSANGAFSVDQTGAATMTAVTIRTPGGTVLLSSGNSSQITSGNISSWLAVGAITDTYIGGDLKSTNWNGSTGTNGTGWLMQRSGNLYANSVSLRGAIMGGAYTGYVWPDAGAGGGYYLGSGGLLLGSAKDNKYFQITTDGNVYAPNFSIVNGTATFSGAVNASAISGSSINGGNININGRFIVGTDGATTIQSGTSGQRTVISSNGVNVYDGNGTLRVRMGIW